MEIKSTTIEAKRVAAQLQLMVQKEINTPACTICKFNVQIVFFNTKVMYKVLTSRNGHSQTCSDINNINKHISLILYDLFLFHVIHTYASILRFPTLHHSLWEIYHSVLDLYRYPISRHLLHHTQQGFLTIIHCNVSSPSTEFSLSRKHLVWNRSDKSK